MPSCNAFVLAAGLGTRLRPLTDHRPKPLCPICGVPILAQSLALLEASNLRDVVVNAHHLSGQIQSFVEKRSRSDFRLRVQVELPDILGTGGGLRKASDILDDTFVVLNGDILCHADLGALLGGLSDAGTDAVMLLRRDEDAARYGVVAVDPGGRVVRLSDVASLPGANPVSLDTHFTGVHALRRQVLDRIPASGTSCVIRTVYRDLVTEGRVTGIVHVGSWVDVGSPAEYLRANLEVLAGRVRPSLDPWAEAAFGLRFRDDGNPESVGVVSDCDIDPRAFLVGPVWLGPGAVIGPGAEVGPGVVVGAAARVGAHSRLRRCVVWDGVGVPADTRLQDAVVHDGGVLRL
jgi:NDP-sugar pyrophosphorylase family protein